MFEPTRGGTRGGQAEFKWSDVSADKDREHYLGHSINAPTGRWQKNKDVHWYCRDMTTAEERLAEIRRIKEAEEEAMSQALGFAPEKKSSAVAVGILPVAHASPIDLNGEDDMHEQAKLLRKMEKKKKKAEKEAKKALKESRRFEESYRGRHESTYVREGESRPHRRRSRSRSPASGWQDPREREEKRYGYRRTSASPPPRSSRMRFRTPPARSDLDERGYSKGIMEREREREDRRRWDKANARRDGRIAQ